MRLAMIFAAASLASACGSGDRQPPAEEQLAAAAPVTIELPPELPQRPSEAPQPEEKPLEPSPPGDVPEEAAKVAKKEAPPTKKAEEPAVADEPAEAAVETPEPTDEVRVVEERPPLSNDQIVRTIQRIGYRCGSVRSAGRVEQSGEGSPVYRISCASGETYRGTNRGGRMYFRPWEGRSGGR